MWLPTIVFSLAQPHIVKCVCSIREYFIYIGLVSDIDSVKVAPPPNAIKSISQNTPFMFKGIVCP